MFFFGKFVFLVFVDETYHRDLTFKVLVILIAPIQRRIPPKNVTLEIEPQDVTCGRQTCEKPSYATPHSATSNENGRQVQFVSYLFFLF
jgi:hypothetical protein